MEGETIQNKATRFDVGVHEIVPILAILSIWVEPELKIGIKLHIPVWNSLTQMSDQRLTKICLIWIMKLEVIGQEMLKRCDMKLICKKNV